MDLKKINESLTQILEELKYKNFQYDIEDGKLVIYANDFTFIVGTISDCETLSTEEKNRLADEVLKEDGLIKDKYFTAETDEEADSNICEDYYGYDHYGPIALPDPDEVEEDENKHYIVQYNGGAGRIEELYKARNGRYIWKNIANGDYENEKRGCKRVVTTDYKKALELCQKYGGTVETYEDCYGEY